MLLEGRPMLWWGAHPPPPPPSPTPPPSVRQHPPPSCQQHGLSFNKMALITSDCGAICPPSIKRP